MFLRANEVASLRLVVDEARIEFNWILTNRGTSRNLSREKTTIEIN